MFSLGKQHWVRLEQQERFGRNMCCASSEQFIFAIEYENQAGSPETMPFFTQHHIPLSLLVLICEPCWCRSLWGPAGCEAPGAQPHPAPTAGQPPPPAPAPQPGWHTSSRNWHIPPDPCRGWVAGEAGRLWGSQEKQASAS